MKFYLKRKNKQGLWVGNTTNFVKVTVESNLDLKIKLKEVQIQSFDGENLKGLLKLITQLHLSPLLDHMVSYSKDSRLHNHGYREEDEDNFLKPTSLRI